MTDPKPPTFYLNLYTDDPKAALEFFEALDFAHMAAWGDDKTAVLTFPAPNATMALMLHRPSRMKEFIRPGTEVGDARKTTSSIYTIAAQSREEVDAALEKAVGAGGKADPYVIPEHGAQFGLYVRSFEDLDGHLWEVASVKPGALTSWMGLFG